MNNTEEKLTSIFETVFPDVPAEKIRSATQDSISNWDSVAAITLMNLIEEEFGFQMEFDDLGELTSFGKIRSYIDSKLEQPAA